MARTNNRVAVIITAAALTAVAAFIVWRVAYPPDVPHFAVVIDRSGSPSFPVCPAVAALVRQALGMAGAVKESHLSLIATGDRSNDFQGMLVKRTLLATRREVAGKQRKQLQRENEYVEDLAASCAGLPAAPRSPIRNAIAAAVADLRGLGCQSGAGCRVDVVSDGGENVDPTLAAALAGNARAEGQLARVIDNSGIAIAFCGAAQSPAAAAGRGVGGGVDRLGQLHRVWSAVFSDPALVSLKPFCGDGVTNSTALR